MVPLTILIFMAFQQPKQSLELLAISALLIAFFSATQDIAYDAYRTDILEHYYTVYYYSGEAEPLTRDPARDMLFGIGSKLVLTLPQP